MLDDRRIEVKVLTEALKEYGIQHEYWRRAGRRSRGVAMTLFNIYTLPDTTDCYAIAGDDVTATPDWVYVIKDGKAVAGFRTEMVIGWGKAPAGAEE